MYHDGYKERIEALVIIQDERRGCVGEKKKPAAESTVEMLRETHNLPSDIRRRI